jgi:hypothetical protein
MLYITIRCFYCEKPINILSPDNTHVKISITKISNGIPEIIDCPLCKTPFSVWWH